MALRNCNHALVEPMIYQGTADSNTVCSYFEHTLPRLKIIPRESNNINVDNNTNNGLVVIMDNASYHKSKELKQIFEQNNCLLVFLPPYSPDLNPIENIWGTIKQNLRNFYDYTATLFENLSRVVSNHTE